MIYGVATLAACMLTGSLMGRVFGSLIGVGRSVGSVGFSIILLVLITNCKEFHFTQKPGFAQGVGFWKAMFIPVVIAMTATQDVFHMLSSGIVAIAAGASAVGLSFLLLYLLRLAEEKKGADRK